MFNHSLRHTTQQQTEKQGLACPGFAAYVEIKHSLKHTTHQHKGKAEKACPVFAAYGRPRSRSNLSWTAADEERVSAAALLA